MDYWIKEKDEKCAKKNTHNASFHDVSFFCFKIDVQYFFLTSKYSTSSSVKQQQTASPRALSKLQFWVLLNI